MNPKKTLDSVQAARVEIEKLTQRERDLRAAHAGAITNKTTLIQAMQPGEELVANAAALVDFYAKRVAENMKHTVLASFTTSFREQTDGTFRTVQPDIPWELDHPGGSTTGLTLKQLCAFCPDAVKAGLARIIRDNDEMFQPRVAMADREAKIAEATQRILDIEAEHSAIVDTAIECGLPMEHLPTVKLAREQAARQRELEAQDAAVRKAAEDETNRQRRFSQQPKSRINPKMVTRKDTAPMASPFAE